MNPYLVFDGQSLATRRQLIANRGGQRPLLGPGSRAQVNSRGRVTDPRLRTPRARRARATAAT